MQVGRNSSAALTSGIRSAWKLAPDAVQNFQAEITRLQRENAMPRDQVPDEYCCPLSLSIMVDPVIASDGTTYEREEIERTL